MVVFKKNSNSTLKYEPQPNKIKIREWRHRNCFYDFLKLFIDKIITLYGLYSRPQLKGNGCLN